jgi:hypothetical protein
MDRSRGYAAIYDRQGQWLHGGRATCPICGYQSLDEPYDSLKLIFKHIFEEHSEQDKVSHQVQLEEMFMPWLTGKEPIYRFLGVGKAQLLIDELKELFASQKSGAETSEQEDVTACQESAAAFEGFDFLNNL